MLRYNFDIFEILVAHVVEEASVRVAVARDSGWHVQSYGALGLGGGNGVMVVDGSYGAVANTGYLLVLGAFEVHADCLLLAVSD